MNTYLPLFPGSSAFNKIPPKEVNKILLHTISNGWEKQAYIQGWGFEGKTYKETCEMFECMDISRNVYKGTTTSKTKTRSYAKKFSNVRKIKG